MHKIVIADSSCPIVLSKINELDLSQRFYGKIMTTLEVAKECEHSFK
jgi:predicted nucleic acid-binding protein